MGLQVTRRSNSVGASKIMDEKEEGESSTGVINTRAKRSRELQSLESSELLEQNSKRSRAASETSTTRVVTAADDRKKGRWRAHEMADEYVEMASYIALQNMKQLGPYGFDPANGSYPLEAVSVLSYLKSPMRIPTVLERWAPLEIALFEAAIAEHGKEFHRVQKEIKTKTTREVIDFYYIWKKTAHYKRWKKQYVPPYADVDDEDKNDRKPVAR